MSADNAAKVIRSEVEQNDGPLPDYFIAHVVRWLVSNEKHPSEVRHGRFPLGMVRRWIERAEEAEAERNALREALEQIRDISPNSNYMRKAWLIAHVALGGDSDV